MDDGALVDQRRAGRLTVLKPDRLAAPDRWEPFFPALCGSGQELPGLRLIRFGQPRLTEERIQHVASNQFAMKSAVSIGARQHVATDHLATNADQQPYSMNSGRNMNADP